MISQHSPPTLPCVRHAADDGAEHEGCDKGKEHQVDQSFQTVVAQPRHSLYVVLRREKQCLTRTGNKRIILHRAAQHDNTKDIAIHRQ